MPHIFQLLPRRLLRMNLQARMVKNRLLWHLAFANLPTTPKMSNKLPVLSKTMTVTCCVWELGPPSNIIQKLVFLLEKVQNDL